MRFEVSKEYIDNTTVMIVRPVEKLSDTEYDNIKFTVEGMGGHWRERVNGFVFYNAYIQRTVEHKVKEDLQFFPTPKSVANRVAELSGIRDLLHMNLRILEPSAGDGALLKKLPLATNHKYTVIEPYEPNVKKLKKLGFSVLKCSFEEYCQNTTDKFTHIIMNPPFSRSRDVIHVMKAYDLLEKGGRLVAIISENSMYYSNKYSVAFSKWLKNVNATIEPVSPGSFKESGTMVDTVIIVINK